MTYCDRAKQAHELLSRQGVRLFSISLNPNAETMTWIHLSKTVEAWRADLRTFISELQGVTDEDGWANDQVHSGLFDSLREAGYIEVDDVVSDVYEGRITVNSASIRDDPAHEEQPSGFGTMAGNPRTRGMTQEMRKC